ncbi:MAG: four helix bundle protein [Candidatus Caldatribacteriota bacterium]|jgi:four helix bundle protein|nr:four helix bundle protein [Atribacterota bacterium]
MSKINSFSELTVWKKSRSFTKSIYKNTNEFPSLEEYGLKSQITRAAVSIMSNIAEGFHRYSKKEFINFLVISRASIAEVQSHLFVAFDLKYITKEQFNELYSQSEDIFKQINALIKYLRTCKDYNVK